MRVALLNRSDRRGPPGRLPGFPSPALLQAGAGLAAEGHEVAYLDDAPPGPGFDRVIMLARPWQRASAGDRAAALEGVNVQLLDPWAAAAGERLPGYELAVGECHGDVNLGPGSPVHPWAAPSAAVVAAGHGEALLRAAAAGLAGMRNTALVVADERVPLTDQRLRQLAELVSSGLRERKSLINLYLRAWPADLARERMLDHLSLLPIKSLDVLLGTLHEPSLARMDSPLAAADLVALVGGLAQAGLAAVTTLSLAAGLPGESIDEAVAALNQTLQLAAQHGIGSVRCALRIDGGPPPTDPADQKTRFLAAHPGWSEAEYRGFHDLVAVIRQVAPNIDLVGPGFLPSWDEAP